MKKCPKCLEEKPLSEFNRNRSTPDGRANACKVCRRAWYRARYRADPEKVKERHRRYYHADLERQKQRYLKRADRKRATGAAWSKRNAARCTARVAKRTALKLKATPTWLTPLDLAYLDLIYAVAGQESLRTGIKHHVDHIVPLQGQTVCGLHVPGNLQILPALENQAKGNRFRQSL